MISEDPIRDGLNWYTYCGGNPILYVDPSGLAMLLGHNNDYVFYEATAQTTGTRVKEFLLGLIPGYSLGKWLGETFSNSYLDQYDVQIDLQKYKSYKSYLDNTSAVTGTIDPFISLINSGVEATSGISKGIGKVFGAIGWISMGADFLDIGYEFVTGRYDLERAVEYSGAIRGPAKESLFAAKFAEIYMDIMLKDGLVEFKKLDHAHGKEPWTIKWNDEQSKEFYYDFIRRVYDHKRAVIIPENYGKGK